MIYIHLFNCISVVHARVATVSFVKTRPRPPPPTADETSLRSRRKLSATCIEIDVLCFICCLSPYHAVGKCLRFQIRSPGLQLALLCVRVCCHRADGVKERAALAPEPYIYYFKYTALACSISQADRAGDVRRVLYGIRRSINGTSAVAV